MCVRAVHHLQSFYVDSLSRPSVRKQCGGWRLDCWGFFELPLQLSRRLPTKPYLVTLTWLYRQVIDLCGQDGWILLKFRVHKCAKKSGYLYMAFGEIVLRDTAGGPDRARYRHLGRSCCQSITAQDLAHPAHSQCYNELNVNLTKSLRGLNYLNQL